MAAAVDHLDSVIDEAGPFDGAIGFSQGAALIVAHLHQCEVDGSPSPFKFALFFSSVLPCSIDMAFGGRLLDRICPLGQRAKTVEEALFINLLNETVIPAQMHNCMLPDFDIGRYWSDNISGAPRLMHAAFTETKIHIPTVHITGKKDAKFMINMANAAYSLCDERTAKRMEHSGGHSPPQNGVEARSAVRALEWAISRCRQTNRNLSL
jgi:hypothetical protein